MPGQIYFSLLNPAIAATFGLMFFILWRRWPWQPHLGLIALAFTFAAIGFAVFDLRVFGADVSNRLVSNGAFIAAVLSACWAGLLRVGAAVPARALAAIVLVGFGLFGWFLIVDPSIEVRIVVMGLTMAGITGVSTQKLLRMRPMSTADRLVVTASALCIILSLLRPVLTMSGALQIADGPSFQQSSYWLTVQAFSPILLGSIALLFLAAMGIDIFERLGNEANQDYLTGLLNRRGFETAMQQALDKAGERTPALLVADIDNFKRINDTFGHKAGDEAIAAVGRALSRHGIGGVAARIGGEEFALFYTDSNIGALQEHAEAIRVAMRELAIAGLPPDHRLTLSIGLHERGAGETLSDMLVEADRALYRAKAAGKDRAAVSPARLRSVRSA